MDGVNVGLSGLSLYSQRGPVPTPTDTLSTLRKRDVREKLDPMKVSNKTLANMQSVLRKALDDAVDDELIETNPLAGWCYSKVEAPKETDQIDPFTKEEQAALLSNVTGQGRNLIQFALWTGLRTSELVALDWGDIDFVRGVVMVSRAITQKSRGAEATKTSAGRREVKLLTSALEALQAQKQYTFMAGAEVFPEPELQRAMEQRPANPQDPVGICGQARRCAVPAPLPDSAYVREHDALRRGTSDVGGKANGACGLDDDRQGVRTLDA